MLTNLLQKCARGARKALHGQIPDFVVAWREERRRRRWKRLIEAPGDTMRIRTERGTQLELPKNSMLAKVLVLHDFELGERRLLLRLLKTGDLFIDVGANAGLFSVIAAKCVGPAGRVVSVEPSPGTAALLRRQIALNQLENVVVVQCGISSAEGELTLNEVAGGHDAFNSFTTPIAGGDYTAVTVPVRSLDSIVRKELDGRTPSLIKIDTEGWELEVFKGAAGLLAAADAPNLIVEFCEPALRNAGSSCEEVYRRLAMAGYRMGAICQKTGRINAIDAPQPWPYLNLLASKRGGLIP